MFNEPSLRFFFFFPIQWPCLRNSKIEICCIKYFNSLLRVCHTSAMLIMDMILSFSRLEFHIPKLWNAKSIILYNYIITKKKKKEKKTLLVLGICFKTEEKKYGWKGNQNVLHLCLVVNKGRRESPCTIFAELLLLCKNTCLGIFF